MLLADKPRDLSQGGKFNLKRILLQDLLSSVNAVISTNERIESITGHMTYNPALQTTTTIHSRIFAKFQTCS